MVAIASHGYKFAESDQSIFIPYILRLNDPNIFPNDIIFDQISSKTSVFYPLIAFLTKFADLQLLFFAGFLLMQIVFFLAIFKLAYAILKNKTIAYLALPLFFLPKFIGGTATLTFDDFFTYRSVGTTAFIFYLAFLIEKKFKTSALFAFASFLFHPLSIIPNAALLPIFFAKDKFKISLKKLITILLASSALIVTFTLFLHQNNLWLSIIKFRDSYLFISTWAPRGILAIFLYLILLFFFLQKLPKQTKKNILLIIYVCLVVFVANYISFELFQNPQLAKFQLIRSINPIAYLSLVVCGLFLTKKDIVGKIVGIISYSALSLNLFEIFAVFFAIFAAHDFLSKHDLSLKLDKQIIVFAAITVILGSLLTGKVNPYKMAEKVQFPKQQSSWIKLQLWAKENTDKSALFLAPIDHPGFRIYSQRSIVTDIKDGAIVIYNQKTASEWHERYTDAKNFYQEPRANLDAIVNKYNPTYIIINKNSVLPFKKVYEDDQYDVLKVN